MTRQHTQRGPSACDTSGPENDDLADGSISSDNGEAKAKKQHRGFRLDDLANSPIWVAWREETRKRKEGRKAKVPYSPHTGRGARVPSDPSTWGTRKQAYRRWRKLNGDGQKGGVGIVLGELDEGHVLMGLDLDRCFNKKGVLLSWADEIVDRFNTYTEVSPSNRGVKLFFLARGEDTDEIDRLLGGTARKTFSAGKHREVAIDRGRYYAVTDDQLEDTPDTMRVVDVEDIRWFVEEAGPRYWERYKPKDVATNGLDKSRSGHAFRFLRDRKSEGLSYSRARKAILADNGPAGEWAREKGDPAIERTWNNITITAPVKKLELVCAADVVIKPIDWLWRGHLARGNLEMTAGQPGIGKSQMQIDWMATITTGGTWPDGTPGGEPGTVLMITAEDCLPQVVVPRLLAAGADIHRVHSLMLIRQDDRQRAFLLGEDLDKLDEAIAEKQAVAVAIDPITAFMGKIDSHRATDVRNQLTPLADLAEKANVAVSVITHPPKGGGKNPLDHFIGSQSFIAAARIGHLVLEEMEPDEDGRPERTGRVLVTNPKNNLHPTMPTLAYRVEQRMVGDNRAQRVEAPYIEWDGTVDVRAEGAIAAMQCASKTDRADTFLKSFLAEGEQWEKEVMEAAETKGFTESQVRRAKERLGVSSRMVGFDGWKWRLPEDDAARG